MYYVLNSFQYSNYNTITDYKLVFITKAFSSFLTLKFLKHLSAGVVVVIAYSNSPYFGKKRSVAPA